MKSQTRSNDTAYRDALRTPPTPAAPATWAEVDGYHLHQFVRRTPAADVYLGYYHATRTYREVIVVRQLLGVDPAALRGAVDVQVFTAGALRHTGVAPVVDVGRTRDGRLYVASARPVGRPLSEILAEDGALTDERALNLGPAIIDVVAAAHDAGLVHGWLTPDSVVVLPTRGGQPERVVVVGFGTAVAQDGTPVPRAFSSALYPFASPERAAGEPASVRGDVFSLGSVILSMFVGGPPPVVLAASGGATPAGAVPEPQTITQVVARARAAAPIARYASAADFGAALVAVGRGRAERVPAKAGLAEGGAPTQDPVELLPIANGAVDRGAPVTDALLGAPRPAARPAPAALGNGRLARRGVLVLAGVVGVVAAGGAAFAWGSRTAPVVPSRQADAVQPPTPPASPRATPTLVAVTAPADAPTAAAVASPPPAPVAPPPRTATAPARHRAPVARPRPAAAAPVPRRAAVQVASVADRRAVGGSTTNPSTAVSAAGDVVAAAPLNPGAGPAGSATVGTEAASSAAGVRAAVAEYATAIEAHDVAGLQRVYPGMTEQQRRAWATFFGSVTGVRARLVVGEVTAAGGTARARVRGTYEYQNLRPHRAERLPVSFMATLVRDASGWRVRTVE